ncbi:MAG: penicillin-binding transpeptidase domain-containing protein [Anaerolineae bacterium]|nr:penicillin-binding transpeptidase domain-containing protein [Anaerolineae bacterium]MDW8298220.1 penicillin-binding transpeptidase domain-containing protein [Anaerolineae bacterium]
MRYLLLFACVAALLSACRSADATAAFDVPTAAPIFSDTALREAQRVAADFLNAWRLENFSAMHALLALNSRDAYPLPDFEAFYRAAHARLTLKPEGLRYNFASAILRGAEAAVAYDLRFETSSFGSFEDKDRIMRLVNTEEGWRVAWSRGDLFAEMADGAVLDVIQSRLTRGNIYDREGEVIADMNGITLAVTLLTRSYPTDNPEACFAELARVFPARSAETLARLLSGNTGRDFAYEVGVIAQERFFEVREALERHCTLRYEARPTRRYLMGDFAPHVIGYIGAIPAEQVELWEKRGYPRDALIGLDGVERQLESVLSGQGKASLVLRRDGVVVRTLAERPGVPSQSVYLTLDRRMQAETQRILEQAFTVGGLGTISPGAAAVVLDVNTGAILALANYPTFNVEAFNPNSSLPNAQALIRQWMNDPRKPTFNRATLGQYPPGSVFKIVSMAAGIESGLFTPNTRYYCSGIWNGTPIGDRTRTDWIASTPAGRHGSITLKQALTGSCNTYFWHLGWTLSNSDPEILPDVARKLGFGKPSGMTDLPEAVGLLPEPSRYEQLVGRKWRNSDALNAVIGQGDVVVTPLQIARMVAAIANGGYLYKPYVVEKIGIISEPSFIAKPEAERLDFKPETLAAIREAMCEVTTNRTLGTATFVFEGLRGAVVCGKTGTAETPTGGTHAWFAAFAGKTAESPEIALVVLVERSGEGSAIAAPIARRLVEAYYQLTPTTASTN